MQEENDTKETGGLNQKQELFCRYYTQVGDLFDNGTLAYAEAYDFNLDELSKEKEIKETDAEGKPIKYADSPYTRAYNVCAVNASKLLRVPKVWKRVIELRKEVLNDDVVDSELLRIIKQDSKLEHKLGGIREYNKMKNRVTEHGDLTSGGKPLAITFSPIFNASPTSETN